MLAGWTLTIALSILALAGDLPQRPAPRPVASVSHAQCVPGVRSAAAPARPREGAIRPGWELGAPGLREKWEAGERDDFWPYGRSMREVLAASER